MAGFFLKRHHLRPQPVEHPKRQRLARFGGDILGIGGEIAHHLVQPVHAERREVIAQRAKVAFRIGKQPRIDMALDHLALDFKAGAREPRQMVQRHHQLVLVAAVQMAQPRAVQRDNTERAGLLRRAEQPVAAFEQLGQVELQPAAHRAHHMRLQFRIHEILEIGQAVFRRHLEQRIGVFAFPGEIGGDVVGGDREGEDPPLGIARRHHLDIGAVDQVHLGLQIAIGEAHLAALHHRHLIAQILGAGPVKGQVGEGRLRAPARGHVEVVDEFLHRLTDLRIAQPVKPHIGRQIGVKGGKRLRPRPFVLQRAQKVDDLPQRAGQMRGRGGFDRAGHAVQPLVQKRAQRPARAIAREHVEIVDMDVALAMRRADLGRIDMAEPVIRRHLARDVQDHPAQRIALIGIGIHPPVGAFQIFADRAFDIDHHPAVLAQAGVLLAVDRIGAGGGDMGGIGQNRLDGVLDRLDIGGAGGGLQRQPVEHRLRQPPGLGGAEFAAGIARPRQRRKDAAGVKGHKRAIAAAHGGKARWGSQSNIGDRHRGPRPWAFAGTGTRNGPGKGSEKRPARPSASGGHNSSGQVSWLCGSQLGWPSRAGAQWRDQPRSPLTVAGAAPDLHRLPSWPAANRKTQSVTI